MPGQNPYESGGHFTEVLRSFSGGMFDDKRAQFKGSPYWSTSKHFDAFTYSSKLMPYPQRVASKGVGGGLVTALKLSQFLYAPSTTGYRLFGLGDDGTGLLKVFKFDIDGATNLDLQTWQVPSNAVSTSGVPRNTSIFAYYKGFIYMVEGTTAIARFDVTESAGFNDSWQTIDNTDSIPLKVQPVHHPNDDIMYFFGEQQVYALNGTSYEGSVLALPSDMQIAAACPFGNYLAIACVTKGNLNKHSIIYLWDRDSSLTTLTERYNMGEGEIFQLANLNNRLIAVMKFYPDNAYALNKAKIQIKTPLGKAVGASEGGSSASVLREIQIDTPGSAADFPATNMVRNDKLFFPMRATLNGDSRLGIWCVDENGKLLIDQYEPGCDAPGGVIRGIFATAGLWWIAYDDGTGTFFVTRTDVDGNYSLTVPAIYETLKLSTIFLTGRGVVIENNNTQKKLIGVTVHTEPLPANASIVLKYRCDGATAWTTIFTYSTLAGTQHQGVNIEATAANLPTYNEIEFRIESYGGASFVGMEYSGEIIDNNLY